MSATPADYELEVSGGEFVEQVLRRVLDDLQTDALGPLFRPNAEAFMTAEITMEPTSDGTRYRALVRHKNAQDQTKHKEMGFFQGWGACLTQLEELAAQLRA